MKFGDNPLIPLSVTSYSKQILAAQVNLGEKILTSILQYRKRFYTGQFKTCSCFISVLGADKKSDSFGLCHGLFLFSQDLSFHLKNITFGIFSYVIEVLNKTNVLLKFFLSFFLLSQAAPLPVVKIWRWGS